MHRVLVTRHKKDEQAQARTEESERLQRIDERDVHAAITQLVDRGWPPEAAVDYAKLMWKYVQLEQELEQESGTPVLPAEQAAAFLSDTFSTKSEEEQAREANEAGRK